MARRKKTQPTAATNGFDPETLRDIVGRLDELSDNLASAKGTYMQAAKRIGDDRKDVLKEARSRGIPPKALKSELRVRDLLRKAEAERASLEAEDAEQAELIREALGDYADLPLGNAAVSAAERRQADAELVDDLAG